MKGKSSGQTGLDHHLSDDGPPTFDSAFRQQLEALFRWRRDVRNFRSDPIPPEQLRHILESANMAPSVGLSQPWRFVVVEDPARRAKIVDIFRRCNQRALDDYEGEDARIYASLKLSGLEDAPAHLAVFCDSGTDQGRGLGRATMPEMLRYSVVAAVQNLWLFARSLGIGVGWVSILDPVEVTQSLAVSAEWDLIAYLCIGYPREEQVDPELERLRWERRRDLAQLLVNR